ncbi:hypothetical protein Tco_0671278 [Tanacetum coccineum]
MPATPGPSAFIQQLFKNTQFMEQIRAYNQMFAMTSFGAKIDHSVNKGRGPNIMHHFGGLDESTLNSEIVEGLIHVLDEHNDLARLFRTARDRCNTGDIPSFKIRLYNIGGVRRYELPIADVLRTIVFKMGQEAVQISMVLPEIDIETSRWQRQRKKITIFCAIEQGRLDFIRRNQNDLRSDFLSGLYDAVSRGDREGIAAGSTIMLSNTFTRGPRLMNTSPQRYLDPMQDPRGYKLVTELMMHGPCGPANLDASCMQNGPCNKHFPKHYNEQTYFDSNGHTQYRRRDTRIHVMKGESRLDNCNVIPYNQALCLSFEAHINVEYCG